MSDDVSDEDLADLYENAPCGYVTLSTNGKIVKLNRTLTGWLGLTPHEVIGRSITDLLSFGARIAFETHISPMLRLQGHVGEIALDMIDNAGSKIPMIANASEKRSSDDRHLLTRISLFKAVDRRKYERSILEARNKAETAFLAEHEAAALREQFIAILGHDLRNPLAAIAAGARLLEPEPLSERGRFIINGMTQSVARAAALIDDVMDFARGRLGGGFAVNRNAAQPLIPVLQQVAAEVQAVAPDREIITKFAGDLLVYCDRQRIGQLAANLISNAVAHGAPGTPIIVEARQNDATFLFSVTNEGQEIPAETRRRLFQPFARGSSEGSAKGLGLGLFIVSQIAKAHQGTIEVASSNNGTTFTLGMPTEAT